MNTLTTFAAHFGIPLTGPPQILLKKVVRAFSQLPYENITKIIKRAECGSPEKARRYPEEVIGAHISWGAGGTCFSLTSALLELVRSLGWQSECILADRRYGQDTHCALLVWIDGAPHLLDPGFLILDPIPIDGAQKQEIDTGFNRLILEREKRDDRIVLSTSRQGSKTYRLTYKTLPVDPGEFLKAWDTSFGWEMMQYPLLTRTRASGQIYLKGERLQISSGDSIERRTIKRDDLITEISTDFGISPKLVAHAISILKSGEHAGGKTSSR